MPGAHVAIADDTGFRWSPLTKTQSVIVSVLNRVQLAELVHAAEHWHWRWPRWEEHHSVEAVKWCGDRGDLISEQRLEPSALALVLVLVGMHVRVN